MLHIVGELMFSGYTFSLGSGDGWQSWLHHNMSVLNAVELYFKMVKTIDFMLPIIHHSFVKNSLK